MTTTSPNIRDRHFPISAGLLFGLGLGGFFDGIVFHQLLQWHHMVSSHYPADTVDNLELNTFWDGVFHASTYVFVVAGLIVLWRAAQRRHLYWSNKLLGGTILAGFGLFNLVEGLVNHHWLGLHHVNETVAPEYRIYWDVGFLIWGALMLAGGSYLTMQGKRESASLDNATDGPMPQTSDHPNT